MITLENFQIYLDRDVLGGNIITAKTDTNLPSFRISLQNTLNASGDFIVSLLANKEVDTREKLFALDAPVLAECVYMYASFLCTITAPQMKILMNFNNSPRIENAELKDGTRSAIVNHIQNLVSSSGYRDITSWVA